MRGPRSMETGCAPVYLWMPTVLLLLSASVREVQSKVYIIRVADSPVVHYDGSIPGYAATAVASNTKLDYTSLPVKKYVAYLQATHDQMLANIYPQGGYTKLYSYCILVNGFAVDIPEDQVDQLATHPGVKQMEADTHVKQTTTYTPEYMGLPSGAWAQNGGTSNAGEDIIIGVVDTGVNPAHPSFANDESKPYGPLGSFTGSCEVAKEFPEGSCNYKLIGARHFSAAAEYYGVFNTTLDFASPFDSEGHGTHTASTAGGNYGVPVLVDGLYFGKASGIAPRARIAVYKALYSFGGFFADVVAAIDQAVADGVDILSLSLGPSFPPVDELVYFTIFDVALLGAVRAGVFVTQAAGNEGPYPQSVTSFSPWIVSAAASYTDRKYINSITLGNGLTLTGSGLAVGTPGTELYTLVLATDVNITSNPNVTVEACQSSEYFDKNLVQGNLLVCTYGFEFEFGIFTKQAVTDTARNLSAAGVIYLYQSLFEESEDAEFLPTLLTTHQLPAILLSSSKAVEEFYEYYNASTKKNGAHRHHNTTFGAKAKLNGGIQPIFTGASPVVASFSSRGPDYNNISFIPADVLKPNVMAPGVSIWAGWTPSDKVTDFQGQNFAIISGTSMATPHIAGIAALVKQKNPTFSPAVIHSALAGTAFTSDKSDTPLLAQYPSTNISNTLGPASPFDLGAGQVDALGALDPGLVFEAEIDDYTKFLCLIPTANSSDVRNATGSGCPNKLSGYPSDLNTPYISVGVLEGSRVVPRTVTSVSKFQESFTVEIESPANVSSTVTPTSFTIARGQSQHLSVILTAQITSNYSSYGKLHFHGDCGHHIAIPITVSLQTLI